MEVRVGKIRKPNKENRRPWIHHYRPNCCFAAVDAAPAAAVAMVIMTMTC